MQLRRKYSLFAQKTCNRKIASRGREEESEIESSVVCVTLSALDVLSIEPPWSLTVKRWKCPSLRSITAMRWPSCLTSMTFSCKYIPARWSCRRSSVTWARRFSNCPCGRTIFGWSPIHALDPLGPRRSCGCCAITWTLMVARTKCKRNVRHCWSSPRCFNTITAAFWSECSGGVRWTVCVREIKWLTSCSLHCRKTQLTESVQRVHDMPSPRFIKSHLPYHLLPTQMDTVKPKIIYTSRNPKDLCVSFYCYCQVCKTLHKNYSKSVKPFIKIILAIASWCTSLWAASRSSVSFS